MVERFLSATCLRLCTVIATTRLAHAKAAESMHNISVAPRLRQAKLKRYGLGKPPACWQPLLPDRAYVHRRFEDACLFLDRCLALASRLLPDVRAGSWLKRCSTWRDEQSTIPRSTSATGPQPTCQWSTGRDFDQVMSLLSSWRRHTRFGYLIITRAQESRQHNLARSLECAVLMQGRDMSSSSRVLSYFCLPGRGIIIIIYSSCTHSIGVPLRLSGWQAIAHLFRNIMGNSSTCGSHRLVAPWVSLLEWLIRMVGSATGARDSVRIFGIKARAIGRVKVALAYQSSSNSGHGSHRDVPY